MDYYLTIAGPKREEIKIEKSKFIASVAPVKTNQEAKMFLEQIKSEFHDARHNCYAYQIGPESLEYKSSDDGEPNGTAGLPILFALKKSGFSDIILVVTRYFGGVKLGKGGLSRAYSEAANIVLEKCTPKQIDLITKVKVFCTYEDISIIKKLVSEYALFEDGQYEDSIEILSHIPKSKVEEFTHKVTEYTRHRAGFKILRK